MSNPELPLLPLVLHDPHPGLVLALGQEGVPFVAARHPDPVLLAAGRFVVHDSRRRCELPRGLGPEHLTIDLADVCRGLDPEPLDGLIDDGSALAQWRIGSATLRERVSRHPKTALRRRLLGRLRSRLAAAGGVWARLAAVPGAYRGAFTVRVDLDSHDPADYARFRAARRPLDDCCTHFISAAAYQAVPDVMTELRGRDAQSHGYYHHIYPDRPSNRRNLERAGAVLHRFGIDARGFCAPMGRWNPGLQEVLEDLGFLYSSEFALAHDDWPFFPYLRRAARFSSVLQVPVHPVCLGLFLDAGITDRVPIEGYFRAMIRAKSAAGEPVFVYGHPDGRLGRHPEVLGAIADEASRCRGLWRTTMTEFARWWRARAHARFRLRQRDGVCRVELQAAARPYELAIEVCRTEEVARLALPPGGVEFRLDSLVYERQAPAGELPQRQAVDEPRSIRDRVKEYLDWEKATPTSEIRVHSAASLLKKGLRRWRGGSRERLEV